MNVKFGIKNLCKKVGFKLGVNKAKRKSQILKELIDNPEGVKLEAYIEGDEIIVKIKKKES
jgi:hypothetical protein